MATWSAERAGIRDLLSKIHFSWLYDNYILTIKCIPGRSLSLARTTPTATATCPSTAGAQILSSSTVHVPFLLVHFLFD